MRYPFFLILLCLWCAPLRALVVEPAALQTQLNSALVVTELEVLEVEGAGSREDSITYQARVRVDRILETRPDGLALPAEGDTIVLQGLGGEANGLGVFLTGYARPRVGRRYKAHLIRQGGDYAVTGFEFGLTPIDGIREFSRNRTDGSNGEGTGDFLYWGQTFLPIPYAISADSFIGHPDYVKAIDDGFATWQGQDRSRMTFLAVGCSKGARNLNDGVNHIILITKTWPFDPAAIAITRNFYLAGDSPRAGMILDSDILLNGVNHEFATTAEIGKHDVQNILTHEVGHFIGLGHETTPFNSDATMFAQASPNETKKRILKSNDVSGLLAAYEGTGTKLTPQSAPSCAIRDASATSCLATHQPETRPPSAAWLAAMACLALIVRFLGRRLTRGPTAR